MGELGRQYIPGRKEYQTKSVRMRFSQVTTSKDYLNMSLSLIGQNGLVHLSCPSGVFVIGRYVKVEFYDLAFHSTPLSFYFASVVIQKSVFTNASEAGIEDLGSNDVDNTLKFHAMANLTIMHSVFKGNAKIWVNGGHFVFLIGSRLHENTEEAATILPSPWATVIVDNCLFTGNRGGLRVSQMRNTSIYLTNTLFSQHTDKSSLVLEFDSFSVATIENITVEKSVIVNDNSLKSAAVYITLHTEGNNSVKISDSVFKENSAAKGVGALIIDNAPDLLTSKGCKDPFNSTIDAYSVFRYTNQIFFNNSVFENNIGQYTGAVLIFNGVTVFTNCIFINNFADLRAGHLSIAGGSGGLKIYNCTFRQNKDTSQFVSGNSNNNVYFLYSDSPGTLIIKDTLMDFTAPAMRVPSLVEIVKGGHVIIDNSSSILCPVGSRLYVDNYSHGSIARSLQTVDSCALVVKMYSIYCECCPNGFYSLQRGLANGTRAKKDFECLSCPFGADCSKNNIVNHPQFWGTLVKQDPPTLQFYICPPNYCDTPNDPKPLVYNGCHGNRSGVLCGACAEGYSETLFSTECRREENCHDAWFWPAAFLYSLLVAIFLVTKPPIVPILKSHILWFKKVDSKENAENTEDILRDNHNEMSADEGYLKVVFYFYQVANLLFTSTTGQTIRGHFLVSVTSIFNFQVRTSSSGFGCPFPGLTVVTKELFSVFGVFAVVLFIFLIYGARQLWAHLRQSQHPSLAPHLAAATEVVLLGYTTLATSAFKLLTVARMGTGKDLRLFFDGNIVFFTWWQYVLLALVIVYVIPFVGLLFWGACWLNEKCITAREFLIASVVPLPFLLYWAIWRRKRDWSGNSHEKPQESEECVAVMKVLYGPFRAPKDEHAQRGTLYWESILIGRRLILIILYAFINNASLRLLMLTMVCVFAAVHHIMWSPYKDYKANKLETVSLITLIIFGLFNTVQATFITSGVRFWGPIRTYLIALGWIQACLLLLLPLVLIIAVIFAVLSQVVRVLVVSAVLFRKHFRKFKRRKSSSVISRKKSFENSKKESLFLDAELIDYPDVGFAREMDEGGLSRQGQGMIHDINDDDEKE